MYTYIFTHTHTYMHAYVSEQNRKKNDLLQGKESHVSFKPLLAYKDGGYFVYREERYM